MFIVLLVRLCLFSPLEAQSQVGFYRMSCPKAELTVWDKTRNALIKNIGLTVGLARLHSHDALDRVHLYIYICMHVLLLPYLCFVDHVISSMHVCAFILYC